MSQIVIQEVTVETVQKGRNKYQVANVVYTDNGKNFNKKVMSFSNPAVFDTIQKAKQGETYEVKVVKDGEYYNWAAINPVGTARSTSVSGSQASTQSGKVIGSHYETPEERAKRQLMIVRQSSISNAIEYLKASEREGDAAWNVNNVLDVAQEFVDFVYGNEAEKDLAEMDNDIPY